MPELLSNIPPQPGLGIETVASQGLVCDQVKSVKDRAANPEAGYLSSVATTCVWGSAAPWKSVTNYVRPTLKPA
jgi:hypothetical protein